MKPEYIFIGFLFLQFLVVFGVVVKYIINKMVEKRFDELHRSAYPEAQVVSTKQKVSYFKRSELMFLLAGPAVLAASMVYSLNAVLAPAGNQDVRSMAEEQQATSLIETQQKVLGNRKNNLVVVDAESSSGVTPVKLHSEETYPYDKVNFSWSLSDSIQDATVRGYFVYFGEKDPALETVDPSILGSFTKSPVFVAENLEEGKTYYLAIQANLVKDKYSLGLNLDLPEGAPGIFGKTLFKYTFGKVNE
ncbi:hypothetical protein HY345_03250 [Candidatus Microgenomates bacterium]|nr:hypothetical protein [Candidatus Microgenomates bacterium]